MEIGDVTDENNMMPDGEVANEEGKEEEEEEDVDMSVLSENI